MRIREMKEEDLDQVVELEQIIFSLPWGNRILSLYSATVIPRAIADFCTVFINF